MRHGLPLNLFRVFFSAKRSMSQSTRVQRFTLQVFSKDKKNRYDLSVNDSDSVKSVLETLRQDHNVSPEQSLVLQFRELKPERTLKSYLIGTEARGCILSLSIFKQRDHLLEIERKIQQKWSEQKAFEVDASDDPTTPKFLLTFPYPYMNGLLHVGHAFSLSKAEFMAGYQRLLGKKVLFPFAFHCTGMPIAACAVKLQREIELFGNPPVFPDPVVGAKKDQVEKKVNEDPTQKRRKKKGKVAKKKSTALYQWQIMREMGVPEELIADFANPHKWLEYFPPKGMDHLRKFGLKADFRRSFITTDSNPYYNRFVEWQFNVLKERGYVLFGKRLCVYSPTEEQPCADHDRASGEGIQPQEYTLIKLKIIHEETPYTKAHGDVLADLSHKNIYLVAGTLRPETMYGQTNCFINPNGDYSAVAVNDSDVFICTKQSARNMSYQDLSRERGKVAELKTLKGWDILGRKLKAPNSVYDHIFTLPMLTINMSKATGVVTSVPSDAPDDYIALNDLKADEAMRKKYYITPEMVDYEVVPIIYIDEEFGNKAAVVACEKYGVKNQYDEKNLKLAKDEVYTKGFYSGKMDIGSFKGTPVKDAKNLIRDQLIADNLACTYWEPKDPVVSRSGDQCVVADVDQWYLKYGTSPWKDQVMDHALNSMEMYNSVTKKKFVEAINWLKQWACSRQFGLGTRLPFAREWVIESLSDSTIYMAYYTIAHILQQGVLDGSGTPSGIDPNDLTDEFFNAIFFGSEIPQNCKIPKETIDTMRREFNFWYPMDLRVSGKDLIGNHLTMSLYNHAAIWPNDSSKWPRSMFTNGHAVINSEKMSKSTGNFMTLIESIEQFSADATRLALADAGDGMEDANFSAETCNAAVLRLTKEKLWIEANYNSSDVGRSGPIEKFVDKVFENDINRAIHQSNEAFAKMQFRVALNQGFYSLSTARNHYVTGCADMGPHKDLLVRFSEVLLLILSPFCPHWCEHMWEQIGKEGLIVNALWPKSDPEDRILTRKAMYIQENSHRLRVAKRRCQNPKKKKGKKQKQPMKVPNAVYLYVSEEYPDLQKEVLSILTEVFGSSAADLSVEEMKEKESEAVRIYKSRPHLQSKKTLTDVMMFSSYILNEFKTQGSDAFALRMPFDERILIRENLDLITWELALDDVQIFSTADKDVPGPPDKLEKAFPGKFEIFFYHKEE
uniref:leucine--tRNA ligase n=2 Tax=Hirondellea gigas TaxID=1518452 RepID=A0A6A7G3Q8_9CRUS